MHDLTAKDAGLAWGYTAQRGETLHLPKPQPFGAPVFISDAVTPLSGETVLSLLMKRLDAADTPPASKE